MILKTVALTHKGLVRTENQDRYLVKKIQGNHLILAVADGMGGEAAGDYAAEIAIHEIGCMKRPSLQNAQQLIKQIKNADRAIRNEIKKNPAWEGMGSTITCALIGNGLLQWAHVGDSRLFVQSDQELVQITRDQNMAQFLIEEGGLSLQDAASHPSQNQLDQCVGCGDCKPAAGLVKVKAGDLVLLTTDGLHGAVSLEKMSKILASRADIETQADHLIAAALDSGGKDNITAVIARL